MEGKEIIVVFVLIVCGFVYFTLKNSVPVSENQLRNILRQAFNTEEFDNLINGKWHENELSEYKTIFLPEYAPVIYKKKKWKIKIKDLFPKKYNATFYSNLDRLNSYIAGMGLSYMECYQDSFSFSVEIQSFRELVLRCESCANIQEDKVGRWMDFYFEKKDKWRLKEARWGTIVGPIRGDVVHSKNYKNGGVK